VRIREQLPIAARPDQVWGVLADFGEIGRWAHRVHHSRLLSLRPADVGATRRVQLGRTVLLERIVAWESGSRLAYVVEGLPSNLRLRNTWRLEDTGPMTNTSLTSQIDGNPVLGVALAPVVRRDLRHLLQGLKAYVEEA